MPHYFNSNKSVVDAATSLVAFVAGSTKLFHLSTIQTRTPTKNVSMQIGANKPGASQLHVDIKITGRDILVGCSKHVRS